MFGMWQDRSFHLYMTKLLELSSQIFRLCISSGAFDSPDLFLLSYHRIPLLGLDIVRIGERSIHGTVLLKATTMGTLVIPCFEAVNRCANAEPGGNRIIGRFETREEMYLIMLTARAGLKGEVLDIGINVDFMQLV